MLNTSEDNTNNQGLRHDGRRYLLTDENFEAIRKIQSEIYEITEVTMSMRKVINQLITEEALAQVKMKFLKQMNVELKSEIYKDNN